MRAVCLIVSPEHTFTACSGLQMRKLTSFGPLRTSCITRLCVVAVVANALGPWLCPASQALPYHHDAHRPLPIVGSCTPYSSSENQRSVWRMNQHGVSSSFYQSVVSARLSLLPPDRASRMAFTIFCTTGRPITFAHLYYILMHPIIVVVQSHISQIVANLQHAF